RRVREQQHRTKRRQSSTNDTEVDARHRKPSKDPTTILTSQPHARPEQALAAAKLPPANAAVGGNTDHGVIGAVVLALKQAVRAEVAGGRVACGTAKVCAEQTGSHQCQLASRF